MKDWQKVLIGRDSTIYQALDTINRAGLQIALVVDEERRLLGTISDGDVRRALLRGVALTDGVTVAMHTTPTCASVDDGPDERLALMRRTGLHQLPLIDAERRVMGLAVIDSYVMMPKRENRVVIMAGGLGSRLKELTHERPKPMLEVGSRPILETILRSWADQGFHHFYFAVNYKAEHIEAHFGDGSRFGVDIHYLREEKRMGTAGALGLLPERPAEPILVTNADILSKVDFGHLLDFHLAHDTAVTMGVRDYELQVPFGVVETEEGRVRGIEEKPLHRFLISAGINVLAPETLDLVPENQYFDMPNLIDAAIEQGRVVRPYRISGYWLDIGQPKDYEKANVDFHDVFR